MTEKLSQREMRQVILTGTEKHREMMDRKLKQITVENHRLETRRRMFREEKEQLRRDREELEAQAKNVDSPLVAVNALAVEALFLIKNRYPVFGPNLRTYLRDLLAEVERVTSDRMSKEAVESVYGAELTDEEMKEMYAKFKKLLAPRVGEKRARNWDRRIPTDEELDGCLRAIREGKGEYLS